MFDNTKDVTNIDRNSAASREVSEYLRDEVDTLINEAAKDMLNHWTNTNRYKTPHLMLVFEEFHEFGFGLDWKICFENRDCGFLIAWRN